MYRIIKIVDKRNYFCYSESFKICANPKELQNKHYSESVRLELERVNFPKEVWIKDIQTDAVRQIDVFEFCQLYFNGKQIMGVHYDIDYSTVEYSMSFDIVTIDDSDVLLLKNLSYGGSYTDNSLRKELGKFDYLPYSYYVNSFILDCHSGLHENFNIARAIINTLDENKSYKLPIKIDKENNKVLIVTREGSDDKDRVFRFNILSNKFYSDLSKILLFSED